MDVSIVSALTDKGPYLNINEDGVSYDVNKNLYFVLDGFGGSGIGEEIVNEIKSFFDTYFLEKQISPEITLPFFYNSKWTIAGNYLVNKIIEVHKKIYEDNKKRKYSKRAGASITVLFKDGEIVYMLSIGSCVGYLFREGELIKISSGDTLDFHSKKINTSNRLTVPLDAIGLYEDINFTLKEVKIKKNDIYLLLTDGVYGKINNNTINYAMMKSSDVFTETIEELFSEANESGNMDNQSALIVKF